MLLMMYNMSISCNYCRRYRNIPKTAADHSSLSLIESCALERLDHGPIGHVRSHVLTTLPYFQ